MTSTKTDGPLFAHCKEILNYYDLETITKLILSHSLKTLQPPKKYSLEEFMSDVTDDKELILAAVNSLCSAYERIVKWQPDLIGEKKGRKIYFHPRFYQFRDHREWYLQYARENKAPPHQESLTVNADVSTYFKENHRPEWTFAFMRKCAENRGKKQFDLRKARCDNKCPKNYSLRETMSWKGDLDDSDHNRWVLLFKGFAAEAFFPIAEDFRTFSNVWTFKVFPEETNELIDNIGRDTWEKNIIFESTGNGVNCTDPAAMRVLSQNFAEEFFELSVKRGLDLDVYESWLERTKTAMYYWKLQQNDAEGIVRISHNNRTINNIGRLFLPYEWHKLPEEKEAQINLQFPKIEQLVTKGDVGSDVWEKILNGDPLHTKKHDILYDMKHHKLKILQPTGGSGYRWSSFKEANSTFGWIESDGHNTWVLHPNKTYPTTTLRNRMVAHYIGPDPNNGNALQYLENIRNKYHQDGLIKDYVVCLHKFKGDGSYWANPANMKRVTSETKDHCIDFIRKRKKENDEINDQFYPYGRKNPRVRQAENFLL